MLKYYTICIFSLLMLFSVRLFSQGKTFTNPIKQNAADPFMVFYEGFYYLTYTRGNSIRISKAESIKSLAAAKEVEVWRDSDPVKCCHMWAPEMYRLNGPNGKRWYMYYTAGSSRCCSTQKMHVLESVKDDPLGPYIYKSRIYDRSNDSYAIDGTVIKKNNDELYYSWSGGPSGTVESPQELYIAKMQNPWTLSGERVKLSSPVYDWEKELGRPINEAPSVLYKDNLVYLTYSASPCWSPKYALGMLSTGQDKDFLDPNSWVKSKTPVFKKSEENNVYGTGHNGFFTSPDGKEDWIIYHAVENTNGSCGSDRSARIQKIRYSNGVPDFGEPLNLTTVVKVPSGDPGLDCLPDLSFTQPITTGIYLSSNSITASSAVVDNNSVTFNTKNNIELRPGFKATFEFSADIGLGCESTLSLPANDNFKALDTKTVISEENSFNVFPNPASNEITMKYDLDTKSKLSISILDITGKIKSTLIDEIRDEGSFEDKISIDHLPDGIYFFKLQVNRKEYTQKVIIQKWPLVK